MGGGICFNYIFLINWEKDMEYSPKVSVVDVLKLRNYIVKAIQELPTYKNIIELYGDLHNRYKITLLYKNKTVSLDIGIEDDACVLRSSEMYTGYSFKYSRFGNISMQRIVSSSNLNENIGASLTTDTVNEVLCYLSSKFKKISLFKYISPALNKWGGKANILLNKPSNPIQSYLVMFDDYKSLTIEETSIPEELYFVSMNCNGEEGFIKILENGEDIEIAINKSDIENKDLKSFIDHLVKELNATLHITHIGELPNKEDNTMENNDTAVTTEPVEEQLNYPVIIRLNEFDTSVKMIERNIKAGVRAVKAMFERDADAISLAHSITVRDSNESTGVRVITLQHSSVYRLGDNTRLNGHGELVILPRNEVPEVRAALMSSILVDSEYTAKLVEQHDKLYGMMK